jgi:hypothetical protein
VKKVSFSDEESKNHVTSTKTDSTKLIEFGDDKVSDKKSEFSSHESKLSDNKQSN